ncbi:MAG: flagellar hook-basal body complex protein FliE, partial [Pseudomonadota bacterium]|nr:flagellar hook-basal body complex protein FliE [Pseudomonadota bacterium]
MQESSEQIFIIRYAYLRGSKNVGADQQSAELLAGTGSIHETMIALEEAGIKLRMAGAVRDRVVSAYQDLTRM